MYVGQVPWVELYNALLEYDGADAQVLLAAWPGQHSDECRWLASLAKADDDRIPAMTDEDSCRLYALSRVTATLLLRFQSGRADGSDYPGPPITVDGFRQFHEAIGFVARSRDGFHPFFHEITRVDQSERPDAPIAIVQDVQELWPALMLGRMMYCRAGCVVTGGASHVVKKIAEGSTMYWTCRRKDRRRADASDGWGSNSQWRTRFRRDYELSAGFHYNVDGQQSLNSGAKRIEGIETATLIELVRHRCLIKTALVDSDLFPNPYTFREPA